MTSSQGPSVDPHAVRQVFGVLFGDVPPDEYIHGWTLSGKRSLWLRGQSNGVETLLDSIRDNPTDNYYTSPGLSHEDRGPYKRCKENDVSGIVALALDLDIEHPCHAQVRLPPTRDAAIALVRKLPLEPTIIIDSGHGLQSWYRMDRSMTMPIVSGSSNCHGRCTI